MNDLMSQYQPPPPGQMRYVRNFQALFVALRNWAFKLHSENGQTWADGKPYGAHLDAVVDVLNRFGYVDMENPVHQVLRLSALAHDLLEDVNVDPITLRVLQGPDVLALVSAVTDEPGANRAERHAKTYPKIAATPWALVLKMADRISNVEASLAFGPAKKLTMYRQEHPGFREALYRPGGPEEPMWALLDELLETAPAAAAPVAPERDSVGVQTSLFQLDEF